jgi:hypothetical protein
MVDYVMAILKGTKRYQHNVTGQVKYFKNPPNLEAWSKVGTPGSKNWCWINNTVEEKFVKKSEPIPDGYSLGRVKT